MGYNIIYEGIIEMDKPLDDNTYGLIMGLSKTRRMRWNTNKLEEYGIAKISEIGICGEFFIEPANMTEKQKNAFEAKYLIDGNEPPGTQPALWGVWSPSDDKLSLIWNNNGHAYMGHEWLQYIVKKILIPRGYYPRGVINWFSEGSYYGFKCHTIVDGKYVRKYKGYSKEQKEPDIKGWYDGW